MSIVDAQGRERTMQKVLFVVSALAGLAQSVRTLESYLSIGFFDRVRAAIAESAESLRPVALEKRVAGLRRLVWLLLLLQLGTLGLLAVLNAPEIAALAGVAASP